MIYILSSLLAGLYAAMIIGFWRDVCRFGKWHETAGHNPHMFGMDGLSVYLALMVCYYAASDWFGFTLPLFHKGPPVSWESTLMAVVCAAASVTIGYFNGRERFLSPTYAGRREATLRFLAAHQIIDAAEVAAVLRAKGVHQ